MSRSTVREPLFLSVGKKTPLTVHIRPTATRSTTKQVYNGIVALSQWRESLDIGLCVGRADEQEIVTEGQFEASAIQHFKTLSKSMLTTPIQQ